MIDLTDFEVGSYEFNPVIVPDHEPDTVSLRRTVFSDIELEELNELVKVYKRTDLEKPVYAMAHFPEFSSVVYGEYVLVDFSEVNFISHEVIARLYKEEDTRLTKFYFEASITTEGSIAAEIHTTLELLNSNDEIVTSIEEDLPYSDPFSEKTITLEPTISKPRASTVTHARASFRVNLVEDSLLSGQWASFSVDVPLGDIGEGKFSHGMELKNAPCIPIPEDPDTMYIFLNLYDNKRLSVKKDTYVPGAKISSDSYYSVDQGAYIIGSDLITPGCQYAFIGELYTDFDALEDKSLDTRYGGISEVNVQSNTFIPASVKVDIISAVENNTSATLIGNEGDTFFQRWDSLKAVPRSSDDVNQKGRNDIDRGTTRLTDIDVTNFGTVNPVYSLGNNMFKAYAMDEKFDLDSYESSITWSMQKNDGADIDEWLHITLASSLKLDGDKGKLNALRRFNNSIVSFQDKGIAEVLFNSRTQITTADGVPIEIANSGKVEGKRYISDKYGAQNKWSIVEGKTGLFFVDNLNKIIGLFSGNGVESLSTKSQLDAWVRSNNSTGVWNPKDDSNTVAFYDKAHSEVYFVNSSNEEQPCLVYSEVLGGFVGFYDYSKVQMMTNISDRFVSYHSDKNGKFSLWLQNEGDYCNFYGEDKPFWITWRVAPDMLFDKIWTNIEYQADFLEVLSAEGDVPEMEFIDGDIKTKYTNKTFDSVEVWNEYQTTGEVSIPSRASLPGIDRYPDVAKKFRTWRMDIPRATKDVTSGNKFGLDRIRNPWVYVKLKKNSATCSMSLPNILSMVPGKGENYMTKLRDINSRLGSAASEVEKQMLKSTRDDLLFDATMTGLNGAFSLGNQLQQNGQGADITQYRNRLADMSAQRGYNTYNNDSLLNAYDTTPVGFHIDERDLNPTAGQSAMNIGSSMLSGAATGAQLGGLWGGVAGAAVGLLGGIGADSDAKRKNRLNAGIMNRSQAYEQGMNSIAFQSNADQAKRTQFGTQYGTRMAEGGMLHPTRKPVGTGVYHNHCKGGTLVNTGGSHQENPYGGVQVGVDPNGIPNLLEEGEPVYDDYVFSDNIYADGGILDKFIIPKKYAGMLYSEAADKILSEAELRPNDPISNNGLRVMLHRLADAQEAQKQKKEAAKLKRQINKMSPEELGQLESMMAAAQASQEMSQAPMMQQMPQEMSMEEQQSMPMMAANGGLLRRYGAGGPLSEDEEALLLSGLSDEQKQYYAEHGYLEPSYSIGIPGWIGSPATKGIQLVKGAVKTLPAVAEKATAAYSKAKTLLKSAPKTGEAAAKAFEEAEQLKIATAKAKKVQSLAKGAVTRAKNTAAKATENFNTINKELAELAAKSARGKISTAEAARYKDLQAGYTKASEKVKATKSAIEAREKAYKAAQKAYSKAQRGVEVTTKAASTVAPAAEATAQAAKEPMTFKRLATGALQTGFDPTYLWRTWKPTTTAGKIGAGVVKTAQSALALENDAHLLPGVEYGPVSGVVSAFTNKYDRASDSQPTTDFYSFFNEHAEGGPVNRFDGESQSQIFRLGTGNTAYYPFPSMDQGVPIPQRPVPQRLAQPRAFLPYNNTNGFAYYTDGAYDQGYLDWLNDQKFNDDGSTFNNLAQYYKSKTGRTLTPEQAVRLGQDQKFGEFHNILGNAYTNYLQNNAGQTDGSQLPLALSDADLDGIMADADRSLMNLNAPSQPTGQYVERGAPLFRGQTVEQAAAGALTGGSAPGLAFPDRPTGQSASTVPNYSTLPRYAGILNNALSTAYNLTQTPDRYEYNPVRAYSPEGNMPLQMQRFMPMDVSLPVQAAQRAGAATARSIRNSGAGPSTGALLLGAGANTGNAMGTAFNQGWFDNNNQRNAVIGANNTALGQMSQLGAGLSAQRAAALNAASQYNNQLGLRLQMMNNAGEQAKADAVGMGLENLSAGLAGLGTENFRMNQINNNPTLYQYVGKNGAPLYKPIQQFTDAQNAAAEKYDQLAMDTEALRNYISEEDDPKAHKLYQAYRDSLQTLQDNLWNKGYNASTVRDLAAARAGYASDITRLAKAIEARQSRSKEYWDTKHKNPDMVMGADPGIRGLDNYLDNDNYGQDWYSYSGNQLAKEVAADMDARAAELLRDPQIMQNPQIAGYITRVTQKGFTNDEINSAGIAAKAYLRGDESALNSLDPITRMAAEVLVNRMGATGATTGENGNLDTAEYDRLFNYAMMGASSGIKGQDLKDFEDKNWEFARQMALAAAKSSSSNPNSNSGQQPVQEGGYTVDPIISQIMAKDADEASAANNKMFEGTFKKDGPLNVKLPDGRTVPVSIGWAEQSQRQRAAIPGANGKIISVETGDLKSSDAKRLGITSKDPVAIFEIINGKRVLNDSFTKEYNKRLASHQDYVKSILKNNKGIKINENTISPKELKELAKKFDIAEDLSPEDTRAAIETKKYIDHRAPAILADASERMKSVRAELADNIIASYQQGMAYTQAKVTDESSREFAFYKVAKGGGEFEKQGTLDKAKVFNLDNQGNIKNDSILSVAVSPYDLLNGKVRITTTKGVFGVDPRMLGGINADTLNNLKGSVAFLMTPLMDPDKVLKCSPEEEKNLTANMYWILDQFAPVKDNGEPIMAKEFIRNRKYQDALYTGITQFMNTALAHPRELKGQQGFQVTGGTSTHPQQYNPFLK
ncbi:unnamed protein product [Cylicocyclus nassatus]|uniref:Uncharacterized protein n=1 Tax=Cylicocyclus nassatus TaxID=53992 RepID=A0AA36DUI4_CYLNA|nr:unnamed protein product [Cylicocyclus nassatus]